MEILNRFEGKTVISVRIDPGECIQSTLEKFVAEEGGSALVLTAIGSVSKLVVALPKTIPDRQKIRWIKYFPEPSREFSSKCGNQYAELFSRSREGTSTWKYM